MRFDKATVALTPLTISNTLDLAFRALQIHFLPIAGGWLAITVPTCLVVWGVLDQFELNWVVGAIGYALATVAFNAYLGGAMAAAAFGEPFTMQSAWERVFRRGGQLLWISLGMRCLEVIAAGFCIIPAIWVTVRYGFAIEQKVLKEIGERRNDRAVSELIGNAASDLVVRWGTIVLFSLLVWVSLSATIDWAAETLLQRPIIHGRLNVDARYFEDRSYMVAYIYNLLWKDAAVITFLTAVALAVYPLFRIAWFFALIDLRVRQDCWDVELQIEQEAERLAPAPEE